MKIAELSVAADVSIRQIRFLIAEGFVPAPEGGRTYATYGDPHVRAIRRFQRLKTLGFPNAAIRLLMNAREGVPIPIADGITLVVAPDIIGNCSDAERLGDLAKVRLSEVLTEQRSIKRRRTAGAGKG
ncbi:MerR family transcriptional regulator [Pseudolabrys taiwanensis]|uniref:MerR family transcriptional regulator n=1 Tax=Pseudolabrys taiwanensis TaxID=331696 RepID=A0A345ZZH1_9HYPH|nr:helix-turn-helix domain-containing protein [Pseudolabrys taiwanensis]AXK82318.1 MerR family transcriptional regulator [Pseudolabrys taiwanensis]